MAFVKRGLLVKVGVLLGLLFLPLLFHPKVATARTPLATDSAESLSTPLPTPDNQNTTTNPLNLTLSPVSLNLETDPGVPVQAALKIRNNSSTPEQLSLNFGTFTADDSGQRPRLLDPKPSDVFMNWISVDEPNFSIQPGEWKTVTVTFSPPTDAALSYYYTVMVNRSTQAPKPGETVIKGAPAVLVLTTVHSPNAKYQLELSGFKAQWPFGQFLPQTFSVNIKNTGNVHITPQGNIFIDGQGKKDIAILSLNPNFSSVLPNSTRTFDVSWQDGFPILVDPNQPDAPGLKLGTTRWDFAKADRFRIGQYTAHLLLVYDNGERDVPVESFVSFWVVPWQLILVALAVPTVPALLVFLIMRWSYRRTSKSVT